MKLFGEEGYIMSLSYQTWCVILFIVSFVPSLQAQTKEIHSMWTCEIRRLLQLQFTLVKGELVLILFGPGPCQYWSVFMLVLWSLLTYVYQWGSSHTTTSLLNFCCYISLTIVTCRLHLVILIKTK